MQLISLETHNFRSLENICLKFDRLTVLIGENDAGKSSTLDLLEIALGNRKPDDNDYFCREFGIDNENGDHINQRCQADTIEIVLQFRIDENDTTARPYATNNVLTIRKIWTTSETSTYYRGYQFEDSRLDQDFSKLKKPELESLIMEFDDSALQNLKNNDQRIAWLEERAQLAPKREDWILASPRWGDFLPRFERYRALDYSSPDNLVMKTLRQVYEQVIYEDVEENGQKSRRLDKRLREVKKDAEIRIVSKVKELQSFIRRYAPQVKNVSFEPVIDFSGGLRSGEFQIDDGRGLHYLSKVGDGTKRRISMATLDWDREVSVKQATQGDVLPPIIRGYDEPDTNLHYEAQRLMYRAIAEIADTPNSHIQIIICTHSLTMIDRAPAKSINLLRLQEGSTTVERLETDDDPSIERFLSELAQEMGITNTIMFYERCFILIEGETEANALPAFYRTLYKRSLLEDGIRIINVKGNGATKEFLRLMGKNKQAITIAFLDKDTEDDNRGERAKLSRAEFREAGFSEEFIAERMIYIGNKEFEDAFSDTILSQALQDGFAKDGGAWTANDVTPLRRDKKMSDSLGKIVFEKAKDSPTKWGKPELGKCLGRVCCSSDLPGEIVHLFELAQRISQNLG